MSEEALGPAAVHLDENDQPVETAALAPSTYDEFVARARALKAAEEAYRQAQLDYAAAVKKLSEEACK